MSVAAISVLLVLAAEARGPVAVVATSKRPGTEAIGTKVASRALELLQREGVQRLLDDAQTLKLMKDASFPDPRTCNGGQKCVEKLAVLLGSRAVVVSIDVAKLGKSLAIHVEAIGAEGGEPLSSADVSAPVEGWKEQSAVGFITFARELKARLDAPPDAPVVERPKEAKPQARLEPTPQPTRREPDALVRDEPSEPRTAAFVTAGAGGAALVTAGIFAILGLVDQGTYQSRSLIDPETQAPGYRGTEAERLRLAQAGNTKFTVSLISALLGAALGATSTFLFLKD